MNAGGEATFWLRRLPVLAGVSAITVGVCCVVPSAPCANSNPAASIDVSGLYRYSASDLFNLSGTIELAQEGQTVRVVNTTYDFGNDRALEGEGTLVGNTLAIQLVPRNGDTNYRADVQFVFGADGDEFCVGFTDTNGDAGDNGSYIGRRIR